MAVRTVTTVDGEVVKYDTHDSPQGAYSRWVYFSTCGKYVVKIAEAYSKQNDLELAAYEALVRSGALTRAKRHKVYVPRMRRATCSRVKGPVVVSDRVSGQEAGPYYARNDVPGGYTNWPKVKEKLQKLFPANSDLHGTNVMVDAKGRHWVVDLGYDRSGEEL